MVTGRLYNNIIVCESHVVARMALLDSRCGVVLKPFRLLDAKVMHMSTLQRAPKYSFRGVKDRPGWCLEGIENRFEPCLAVKSCEIYMNYIRLSMQSKGKKVASETCEVPDETAQGGRSSAWVRDLVT